MCRAELGLSGCLSLPVKSWIPTLSESLLAKFLALSAEFSGETLLFLCDALVSMFAPFLNVTKHQPRMM